MQKLPKSTKGAVEQFPRISNPNQLRCATNFHIRESQIKIFPEKLKSSKAKENLKAQTGRTKPLHGQI